MNLIEEKEKLDSMGRVQLSQYLEDIPTKYLTSQEMDYMLAQILNYPCQVATDDVIGGYMTYYHMQNPPMWLGWKEVGPCIETYSIQWKKDGDKYIAYNGTTTGYPQHHLEDAIKLCVIRHEYGDTCHIPNIPEWKLRVSNHYDQTVLDLRIKDYLKSLGEKLEEPKRIIDRLPEHIHSVESVKKRFDAYSVHWSPQVQIDFAILFKAIEELKEPNNVN